MSGPVTPPSGPSSPPLPSLANVEDKTSLASGNYVKVLILDQIFKLLIQMIGTLQNVAAAQAERLNFLSQWQKAYTDVMNQIHTFIKAGNDRISFGGSSNASQRNDLNQLNSTYTQNLQNQRSVISDDAKALQSNVSQSNDAVNQQSNLATAIIQQMSTILGSIFR